MNIKIMKNLEQNLYIKNTVSKSQGLEIGEIMNLETNYNKGNSFPKALKEFLYLAGYNFNGGFDYIEGIEELQEMAKEELSQVGENIERPFFAFDVYNSQYSVIFLDEDDEDPKVYLVSPFLAKGGKVPLIKLNGFIFSDLVNESIRRVKNNIPF